MKFAVRLSPYKNKRKQGGKRRRVKPYGFDSRQPKLTIYIYNKQNKLDEERQDLKYRLRNRPVDDLELFEIMRDRMRVEIWDEYVRDLYNIVFHSMYDKR